MATSLPHPFSVRRRSGIADRDDQRRVRFAICASLIAHVVLFALIRLCATSQPIASLDSGAIRLRLIDAAPAPIGVPAALVPVRIPPRSDQANTMTRPAARGSGGPHERTQSLPAHSESPAGSASKPDAGALFDADGRVVLPPPADERAVDAFASTYRRPEYAADPLMHRRALPGRATRFERDWIPANETLAGEWIRKGTVKKQWDTRGGNRVQCTLMVVIPGCSWGWAPRVTIEELQAMRADPPAANAGEFDKSARSPLQARASRRYRAW
jgi:hypothetical protein